MMTLSLEHDYNLFRQAVLSVSSSLDLPKAMRSAFNFLKQHFPLEALSLHLLKPRLRSFHLLFLVTDDQFHYLDEFVPLPTSESERLEKIERELKISNIPHSEKSRVTRRHGAAISPYVPDKDRAYLVSVLGSEQKAVGHLCLIGPESECFGAQHEHKLTVLTPAFTRLMMNLLQYREIVELQRRLTVEKQLLIGTVRSLSEDTIIGAKAGLRKTMDMVGQLTGRDVPVLIEGETGVGKELVADVIQRASARFEAPYIKVNCGAIPENLIDSELFGHEKGAFTGAIRTRIGRFEQADGGTLFLDEIGDMPLNAQVRLLRVLQDNIVERVGGSRAIPVDVRIIAATHRDLTAMLHDGSFRSDLFFRLNVFPLQIPPLRERYQDIPALVNHIIIKKARQLRLPKTPRVSNNTFQKLQTYPWPGNVRELENLVERALIIDPEGPLQLDSFLNFANDTCENPEISNPKIQPVYKKKHEPLEKQATEFNMPTKLHAKKATATFHTLDQAISEHITEALKLCSGRIHGRGGAGDLLGVNPNTLRKRMDKLGIPYGRKKKFP
jgi:transcriptional regulator with GAF, ATPase, and Fis domain